MKSEKVFTKAFKFLKNKLTLEREFVQYFYAKKNLNGKAIPCEKIRSTKREPYANA